MCLTVEQEVIREHGRAARAMSNQDTPLSACAILRDEEVYNTIPPDEVGVHIYKEKGGGGCGLCWGCIWYCLVSMLTFSVFCVQEEKEKNVRSRYNGRQLLSWLQDVQDKYERIKVRLKEVYRRLHTE